MPEVETYEEEIISFGGITLYGDLTALVTTPDGATKEKKRLQLQKANMLRFLMSAKGRILLCSTLADKFAVNRLALDAHLRQLKNTIGKKYITYCRENVGYRFVPVEKH